MCPESCELEKMLRVLVDFVEKGNLPNYNYLEGFHLTAALADAHLVLNNKKTQFWQENKLENKEVD